jgi:LPS-assembly protein
MGAAVLFCAAFPGRSDEPPAHSNQDRGEPATIEAERMSFERPTNLAIGEGNVVVRYKDATLRAERVKLDTVTKDVWAEGNVRLNRQDQEWVAPAVYYNLETRALKTENVRGFFDPLIVRADSVSQIDSNHYAYTRATATTCDYEQPHFRLEATRGEIWPGDRVVLYNATLRIGNVPVFWFPMVVWALKGDNPPIGITLGASSRSGFFFLSTIYFRLNEDVQLGIHLDERTRRGFGTGADLNYRLGETGEGLLRGYYINDAEPTDRLDREAGKDIPTNRYRAQWRHRQELTDDIDLKIYLNKLSDSDIIDDFFNDEFRREREPDSVADITKRGPNYTLSLLARPQFNDFFADVERLPELKLAVNRTRLGKTPVFYEGESSVAQLHADPGDTGSTNFVGSAVRADTFHQLVLPQRYFGWLSVVPRAGVRGTYYSRAPATAPDTEDVTRVVYDLGLETSFTASQTWPDVQNKRLGIDGLRHIVQPFANYQWVREPDKLPDDLFQFDTVRSITNSVGDAISLTRFSPLDFPAFNTIDDIERQNTVRFGLRQKLQTRRGGRPRDLVELTGWTDWRLEQNGGESDFSDFFGTLRVRPWDWFALEAFTRYGLNDGSLRELNTRVRVIDADRWSVGVGTRFLKDDSNLISFSQTYRLTRNWTVQTYHRVDMEDGVWEEQEYSLRQETHDWFINYGVRYREQRASSDEVAVFFAVTLKAYPGIGLSVNRIDVGGED